MLVLVALLVALVAGAASAAVVDGGDVHALALPCTVCEFVVGYVEGYVKANPDATLMQLEDAVKQNVCRHLGSFAPECELLVDAELPAIVKALESSPPEEVCAKVHLCTASSSSKALALELPASAKCDACTFVVGAAATYLREHEGVTLDKVQAEMNKVCAALPSLLANTCRDLVAQQLPRIVDALEHTDVDAVCEELHLCKDAAATATATAADVVTAVAAKSDVVVLEKLDADDDVAPDAAIGCEACKFVVDEIDDMLKKNMTQGMIEERIDELCDATGPYAEACKEWVHMEIPNIIMYLTHMSPANVCAHLKACSAAVKALAAAAAKASGLPCPACHMLVTYVDELIARNEGAELAWLEQKANTLCSRLPSYAAECKYLVAKELENVVKYIEAGDAVDEVCEKIKLCPASPAAKFSAPLVKLVSPLVELVAPDAAAADVLPEALPCTVCEFVVGYVEGYVKQNPDATLKQLETVVKSKVCAHLGLLSAECDALVDEELPAIVDALKNAPPDQVCKQVHLCTSK